MLNTHVQKASLFFEGRREKRTQKPRLEIRPLSNKKERNSNTRLRREVLREELSEMLISVICIWCRDPGFYCRLELTSSAITLVRILIMLLHQEQFASQEHFFTQIHFLSALVLSRALSLSLSNVLLLSFYNALGDHGDVAYPVERTHVNCLHSTKGHQVDANGNLSHVFLLSPCRCHYLCIVVVHHPRRSIDYRAVLQTICKMQCKFLPQTFR